MRRRIEDSWPATKVELWPLDKILPYGKNPRVHSEAQVDMIATSMRDDGVTAPILVDDKGVIIYGHGRRLGALKNGFLQYPVSVAVGWSEQKKRAVRIKDNAFSAASSWDVGLLNFEITELKSAGYSLPLLGFGEAQLRAFGVSMGTDGQADPEIAPAAPAAPVSRAGDCWVLGNHRLLCGDSTVPEDVALALGGAKPHLMVTDPPYGVNYDPAWRNEAYRGPLMNRTIGAKAVGRVSNDDRSDWRDAWALFGGDVAYVWQGTQQIPDMATQLLEATFALRNLIVWNKGYGVISRGDYHHQHETCWYAVRKGSTGHWNGDRKQTTVWDIPKPSSSDHTHGTQKPIECMKRPIENNSKAGDSVYEPFCGSGTTIIACEMTDRHCRAIELDPAYVDVGVLRWQTFTGKEAVLDGSGKTFAQVKAERQKKVRPTKTQPDKGVQPST